jgi:hypothetical protein
MARRDKTRPQPAPAVSELRGAPVLRVGGAAEVCFGVNIDTRDSSAVRSKAEALAKPLGKVFRASADPGALIVEAGTAAAALHAELARLGLPVAEVVHGQIKPVGDRDRSDGIIEIVLAASHFRETDDGQWLVPDYRSWPHLARTLEQEAAKLKPPVGSEDGRLAGGKFRIEGQVFEGLTRTEADLLECYWGKGTFPAHSLHELKILVGGEHWPGTVQTIDSHRKHLKRKVFRQSSGLWDIRSAGRGTKRHQLRKLANGEKSPPESAR